MYTNHQIIPKAMPALCLASLATTSQAATTPWHGAQHSARSAQGATKDAHESLQRIFHPGGGRQWSRCCIKCFCL